MNPTPSLLSRPQPPGMGTISLGHPKRGFPAAMLCVVSTFLAAEVTYANYAGTLQSATPQSPIDLGQSLRIDVVVRNSGTDAWSSYDYPTWFARLTGMAWLPGVPVDLFPEYWADVPTGATVSGTVFMPASILLTSAGTYSLTLRSWCNDGWDTYYSMTGSKTVTFTIVAHPPADIVLSNNTVAENQQSGTQVGTFTSTAQDVGNTFTYSLVPGWGDADNGSFTILGDALQTTAAFDFDSKCIYSVRVRTTDQRGLWYEKPFSVNVTPAAPVMNEEPVLTAGASNTVSWAAVSGASE
ncbi:MAG: cadherin repeat domain-containing protein [Verrucomicrobia bacterium]|nr:cadherin repeat domain-containing protein [Verrucomicrobiota bacterium]